MPEYVLGQVIAERQLQLHIRGEVQPAWVRIGLPYFVPDDEAWKCPYEVEIQGTKRTFAIWGEDSLQALALTLKIIDVELEVRAKDAGGSFVWLDAPHTSIMEAPEDPNREIKREPGD